MNRGAPIIGSNLDSAGEQALKWHKWRSIFIQVIRGRMLKFQGFLRSHACGEDFISLMGSDVGINTRWAVSMMGRHGGVYSYTYIYKIQFKTKSLHQGENLEVVTMCTL